MFCGIQLQRCHHSVLLELWQSNLVNDDRLAHVQLLLTPQDLHLGRVLWRPLQPHGEVQLKVQIVGPCTEQMHNDGGNKLFFHVNATKRKSANTQARGGIPYRDTPTPPEGRLVCIEVFDAEGLMQVQLFGQQSPYVKATLLPATIPCSTFEWVSRSSTAPHQVAGGFGAIGNTFGECDDNSA